MAKLSHAVAITLLLNSLVGCSPAAEKVGLTERTESRVQAAAVSENGEYSLIASSEQGLLLYNLDNEIVYHWPQNSNGISQIRSLAISADNQTALAASRETLALWDLRTGEVSGYWRNDESRIRDVAVSNQGRLIAIGRADGVVVLFEPESGRRLEFFGHSERINSLDISPNGRYVLSGADDHTSLLWNTDTAQVVHRFPASARVTQVRLHENGSKAFTASGQEAVIWDLVSGEKTAELHYKVRHKSFISADFSSDGRYLVTGSPSRHTEVWRTADGQRLASWQVSGRENDYPPRAAVIAVAFIGQSGEIITENTAGFGERWQLGTLLEE